MRTYLVTGLLVFAVSPALAAEFYVALEPGTKYCKIVDTKPDGKTMIMIGASSYATKAEAKAARAATTEEECPHKSGK
jgi:hypothetical protein